MALLTDASSASSKEAATGSPTGMGHDVETFTLPRPATPWCRHSPWHEGRPRDVQPSDAHAADARASELRDELGQAAHQVA